MRATSEQVLFTRRRRRRRGNTCHFFGRFRSGFGKNGLLARSGMPLDRMMGCTRSGVRAGDGEDGSGGSSGGGGNLLYKNCISSPREHFRTEGGDGGMGREEEVCPPALL